MAGYTSGEYTSDNRTAQDILPDAHSACRVTSRPSQLASYHHRTCIITLRQAGHAELLYQSAGSYGIHVGASYLHTPCPGHSRVVRASQPFSFANAFRASGANIPPHPAKPRQDRRPTWRTRNLLHLIRISRHPAPLPVAGWARHQRREAVWVPAVELGEKAVGEDQVGHRQPKAVSNTRTSKKSMPNSAPLAPQRAHTHSWPGSSRPVSAHAAGESSCQPRNLQSPRATTSASVIPSSASSPSSSG